ncbi:ThuA domain-containing protein [Nonomuraea sp. NPDC050536]|uniref:ThuA domain-containing protein n=1 Tax=Nonomuraea sp. NPDC050536 TaxID=3364366 RepID=UPI0037C70F36
MFIPFLAEHGYDVVVSDDLDVYTDTALMSQTDVILQCWTMGSLDQDQVKGLRTAVESGVGLAGWHGGVVDSFRQSADYLQLVGAQFAAHPGGIHEYAIDVVAARGDHDIVRDLPTTITVEDEQYWVLCDPCNEVLATTTVPVRDGDPWSAPITFPAVWTRRWGTGRIFVCTPGHHLPTLEMPHIRTIIERGLLWASR